MIQSPPILMRAASEAWLDHIATRKRRPVKQSSLATMRSWVNSRIVPALGSIEVRKIGVAVLREFIEELHTDQLSPKTQNEIAAVVKAIIGNCKNSEQEPLYPRQWNNEDLDLPVVHHASQRTPIVTAEEIENAMAISEDRFAVLFALCAGSGLRISEALALRLNSDSSDISVFDATTATLRIRTAIWRQQETSPKTNAAKRDVEITRRLSDYIAAFAGSRTNSFLFGNAKPLSSSTARAALNKAVGEGVGWHAFRRYFVSFRRSQGMPEDILKRLVGHSSGGDITSLYNRFGNLPAERREWVERIGLGFDLPKGAA
jgi:integrase